MKTVLTIAGFDPSGGAGILADIETFRVIGNPPSPRKGAWPEKGSTPPFNKGGVGGLIKGVAVVTAVVPQTPKKVLGVYPVDANVLKKELACIPRVDAIKVGVVGTKANVLVVSEFLHVNVIPPRPPLGKGGFRYASVVIDPVLRSTSGARLLEKDAIKTLKKKLFPLATVITPNIVEAEVFSGVSIKTLDDVKTAAKRIHTEAKTAVVIKGGHLKGDPVDVLYDGVRFVEFPGRRLPKGMHGSGCRFSSAIAAYLALDRSLEVAVGLAKEYVNRCLVG